MTTVRLGYVPAMIYAPLFVAIERGYFAQEGIDARLNPVQGGSDSVVQLAAGNFDVAASGAGAGLLNAVSRGVKFKIVAPMHSERPPLTSPLVISAKRTGEIKSVADLRGKKVAINAPGGAAEYWLSEALKRGGLTMKDVQLTSVSFPDVSASLESGSIAAAILGEPFATQSKDSGTVSLLADDFINGFTVTYIYMGQPLLNDKPQVAKGFLRAYLRACRDLQGDYLKNDPDIARIIEKYIQVPASVAARASAPQYSKDGIVPVEDLSTLQSYFMQRGELEYEQLIDVTTFVDDTLAREVASELNRP
jgi:NitT/TauT family transport system substrate-binding protein